MTDGCGKWVSGSVACRACGHRWVSVRPCPLPNHTAKDTLPPERLECPLCHEFTGTSTNGSRVLVSG